MEFWDVLDEYGSPTGRVVSRGECGPTDLHLVVHVWIVDQNGEFLIQRRALDLPWAGGLWAATGGAVIARESSREGAIRETFEELSLDLAGAKLTLLDRLRSRGKFEDVWLAVVDRDAVGTLRLSPEVIDVRWVARSELGEMIERGEFFRYSYVADLLSDPTPPRLTQPSS